VGGIKEKILAAKRAGITDVIMCEANRKDVQEINESYLKDMKFHYVSNMLQVLDIALLEEYADQPLDLMEPVRKSNRKPDELIIKE
jgi:ATP-dependent Lon protease